QTAVSAELGDDLDVVAKTDDGDAILRAGRFQKITRRFANELDSFFHASGNVEQQHQIERLGCGNDFRDLALYAVFVNCEIGFLHAANRAAIAIGHAGVEPQKLWRRDANKVSWR